MEIKDTRIEVAFHGVKNHDFDFTDLTEKKALRVSAAELIGASILTLNERFVLRKLPGKGYIVEGAI